MNKHSDGFRAGEPEVTKSVEAQLGADPLNTCSLVKHLQTLVSFSADLCAYSSYLITQKCSLWHGLEFVGSLKSLYLLVLQVLVELAPGLKLAIIESTTALSLILKARPCYGLNLTI